MCWLKTAKSNGLNPALPLASYVILGVAHWFIVSSLKRIKWCLATGRGELENGHKVLCVVCMQSSVCAGLHGGKEKLGLCGAVVEPLCGHLGITELEI